LLVIRPRASAGRIDNAWVNNRRSRFGYRSAITPPNREKRRIGREVAAATIPRYRGDFVRL